MSKHTSGPWSVNLMKLNGETYHWHVTDAKRGTMNAVAMADEEQGTPRTAEELRANAVLIAAAPDLLDALQSAEMALIGYIHQNEITTAALTKARAAIAKATGQAA